MRQKLLFAICVFFLSGAPSKGVETKKMKVEEATQTTVSTKKSGIKKQGAKKAAKSNPGGNSNLFDPMLLAATCKVQPGNYSKIVSKVSKKYGVDWKLVTAVMAAESSFDPCATSPVGAMGLMQLMPKTAEMYKVKALELYNPEKNILAGVQHLKMLIRKFNGNLKLTIAAYNAGQGNVDKYKGIPPFDETRNYVKKVLAYHSDLKVASMSGRPLRLQGGVSVHSAR